jgi:ATP-dependent Clp protease, protease subunit
MIYKATKYCNNGEAETESPLLPVQSIGEDLTPDDKSNHIYLYGDITTDSLLKIRKKIDKQILNFKKLVLQNDIDSNLLGKIFHIDLHINSMGGYVFDSFAMHDYIRSSPVPVYTYVEGVCASAATIISVSGAKRFMTRSSMLMIHQLHSWFGGKYEEFTDEKLNLDLMMERIKLIYLETTKMKKSKLTSLLKRDLFLEVDKCLEYGFIDHIS